MNVPATDAVARAWEVLQAVPDPEVPAISVCELGIVREIRSLDGALEVVLTPTYSGCPATEVIERSVVDAIGRAGLGSARIVMRRAPAWTSDWISAEGRRKLREYGIAPPGPAAAADDGDVFAPVALPLACPRCGSRRTERLSAFGSTACKALHRCLACLEPFEHFKPI
ncbi:MAG: 1,2-phenylacetyl-CoA epoxidase subunit PaaD [Lautropia sp.]